MGQEETKEARELLNSIFERRRLQESISPSWLATECMHSLDPLRTSHRIEYEMAHLQFRQLARAICAKRWEPDDPTQSEQHDLFPDLQTRYPRLRTSSKEEPNYVRLECLTRPDVKYNVERLRAEGRAKLSHADSLEAWDADREMRA